VCEVVPPTFVVPFPRLQGIVVVVVVIIISVGESWLRMIKYLEEQITAEGIDGCNWCFDAPGQ
jgi:hypothetical protein